MREARAVVAAEINRAGYVAVKDQPSLERTIWRMAAEGMLAPAGPGVFVGAEERRPLALAVAATRAFPDSVITGRAAAAITFWPDLAVPTVCVARPVRTAPRPGLQFTRRQIPADLRSSHADLILTSPALTAIDLCHDLGGDGIDQVLRTRCATLDQLWEALRLTRGRSGNSERRRLLIESRAEPWSRAERMLHELLRAGGIDGWSANVPVVTRAGTYFVDVCFPAHRVVLEVEGVAFHGSVAQQHADRLRQNHLACAQWYVLRIDWQQLTEDPAATLEVIRRCLRSSGHRRGLAPR